MIDELPDEQLIGNYLSGTDETLPVLFQRYLKPVYNFVHRYVGSAGDAEDITQDVFVAVWKNLRRFDQQKKFKTWIFTIAKNTSLNWIKKKKPVLFSRFENDEGENMLAETVADTLPLPDELAEQKNIAERISAVMGRLSPASHAVLLLRYNDHFTFQEIAESLQESIHTVKSRHRRALLKLKELLQENEGADAPKLAHPL